VATEIHNAYSFNHAKKHLKNANFRFKTAFLTHLIYACYTHHKRGTNQSNTARGKTSAHPPHTAQTAAKTRAKKPRKRKEKEF
jgi:hypothetical protein